MPKFEPPVVSDKVVFVVTGLDSLYALSLETGLAVWHHKQALPAGMTLRGQSKPALHRPTAGSEVDRVVLGHADGRLSILEASTGKVLKEVELGENTKAIFPMLIPTRSSPATWRLQRPTIAGFLPSMSAAVKSGGTSMKSPSPSWPPTAHFWWRLVPKRPWPST